MTIIESTNSRLVVEAGSMLNKTKLTFDKTEGLAHFEQNLFLWRRKPVDVPLSDIADIEVMKVVDAASGATVPVPVVRTRSGKELSLHVREIEADETVQRMCDFLGLKPH